MRKFPGAILISFIASGALAGGEETAGLICHRVFEDGAEIGEKLADLERFLVDPGERVISVRREIQGQIKDPVLYTVFETGAVVRASLSNEGPYGSGDLVFDPGTGTIQLSLPGGALNENPPITLECLKK